MAKRGKAKRAATSSALPHERERLELRRALKRARDREREIIALTKSVERAIAAADRAVAELGLLIVDRDNEQSAARTMNESAHADR